jgi:hypothetical protein
VRTQGVLVGGQTRPIKELSRWKRKVHCCRVRICPPRHSILSQLNPVQSCTLHSFNIHINSIPNKASYCCRVLTEFLQTF